MSYDCFVSYASEDLAHAEALHDTLASAGLRVWFDKARLRDGYNWHHEIEAACESSRIVLAVLTPRWKLSEWTRYETYGAEAVIPLVYEGTWDAVKTPPLGRLRGQVMGSVDTERLITSIRELLAQSPPEKMERLARLRYHVNPHFVGREDTLNEIHEKLFTNPTAVLTQGHVAAVTALGGVGKTTLARHYAEKFWRCYRQMFWVDCRRSLDSEFALIHDLLRPDRVLSELKDPEKAAWVRNELNQPGRAIRLLILDNAEDEESIRDWIPKSGNCHTVLTSRFTAWSLGIETCPVWILNPEPARELLLRRSARTEDAACDAVARKLEYLPLALEQAAAYVARQELSFGFSDYLRLYETNERDVLKKGTPGSTEYPDSVLVTWATTVQKLSDGARAVLRLCSFLAPTPIPVALLVKGAALIQANAPEMEIASTGPVTEFAVREWTSDLTSYSMIQLAGGLFSIHSLVQAVERHQVPQSEHSGMIQRAVALMMSWAPAAAQEYQNWAKWRILEPHARYLWQQQDPLEMGSCDLIFFNAFGMYLSVSKGAYSEAEPLFLRLLAGNELVLGEEHPQTLRALNNLGGLYAMRGRYGDAESLYLRQLTATERVLGAEDPDTAHAVNDLAVLYERQGRYGEAEPLFLRALSANERLLGEEHPDTLSAVNNLAGLYANQGRYGEAEPLFQRALAGREKVLGAEHPDTLRAINDLTVLYANQGRYGEAEPLFLRVLAASERVLNPEHPDTLGALNNLAALYESQGRYGEAAPLYQRALAASEQVLGAEHPDTLRAVNNLAYLYARQGRYVEAELLHQRALAGGERVLGAEHPETLCSVNNLANLYKSQGRYVEAEPLYQRALAAQERVLGAEHPATLASANNLAGLYQQQGRYMEAEPVYQRTLARAERVLGEEHPNTLSPVGNLASLYESQGRYVEAEPLYRRALAAQERVLGAEHPATLASANNLAGLYQRQGRHVEAEPLYKRALVARERVLGEEHPDTLSSVGNLASLYESQGRYVEAEPLYRRALAAQERVLGAEHPATLASANNLAGLYQRQGRHVEAEPLYKRALAARERVLGAQHPDTLCSVNNLACLYESQGRYGEAEPLFRRALSVAEKVLRLNHPI